ncbi:peptide deformylase [Gellertiella hungarica]|uniref:Peptide deformylase-like n=1 Tax=Gellertiella hungarica TaxID=1572859 RepID=A0A7W6J500_9HYPH|nr:peptide deformylase [Gellertiella hungarica]MBB4064889.1 peptide deformylase [Gellertiella hungarica]
MSVLPILRYPDPGLKTVAQPVTVFDEALSRLADDLLETMRAAPGVGITACHCGIASRVVVIELKPGEPRLYVNPQIEAFSEDRFTATEGSVSMPGVTEDVERARAIRLTWQDLEGARHEGVMSGFEAVCMQHEIDQLDGIFWIQRLSRLKRERVVKRFQKASR